MQIPEWVKFTTGWWAYGQITDTTYANAIQFLIDDKILVVVYDLLGEKVTIFSTEKGIGKHLLKSNFNLESGQYIISIQKDNVEFKSEKLLITK